MGKIGIGDLVTGPEERSRLRHNGEPYVGRVVDISWAPILHGEPIELVWVEYGEPFNRTTSYYPSELNLVEPPMPLSDEERVRFEAWWVTTPWGFQAKPFAESGWKACLASRPAPSADRANLILRIEDWANRCVVNADFNENQGIRSPESRTVAELLSEAAAALSAPTHKCVTSDQVKALTITQETDWAKGYMRCLRDVLALFPEGER